ncbi:uncharacterized protein LOC114723685 [Neltuma alba]|uniref:uncharacterized protein LOC114723685 n=1 Tax=Neltuma alba TaxID=207710 RepID=UPI0010A4B8DF|nr:uncharacterized protein LOC114723685 [Prosopis alba]
MAANFKISLHCRSKSEPSAPHPLVLQLVENLQRFKSSEASSSSSSSSSIICQNLIGLQDLHDCINQVLQWPKTQQGLARGCCETLVEELLSVRLLDFSDAAKEALIESKETIKDLQSAIRRRRGGQVVVPMRKFLSWRKKVKKAIRKTLENLKGYRKDTSLTCSYKECEESVPMIRILKETELITLTHLQSLLSFFCTSIGQSKHSKWSLVFKLMQPKRVACDYERANTSEFENLDTMLESLLCHKHCSVVSTESFQSHLENLELSFAGSGGRIRESSKGSDQN